jgi:hypothetical protein
MSHRMSDDEFADYGDAPPLQPAPTPPVQAPSVQPAPASPLCSSLLKKPLDAGSFGNPPGFPPKFR